MWEVVTDDIRGGTIGRGDLDVVPVARRWALHVGPENGSWGWMASYAAPAVEVTRQDGEPELLVLPDVGLWMRLGAAVALALAMLMIGGRRWATTR